MSSRRSIRRQKEAEKQRKKEDERRKKNEDHAAKQIRRHETRVEKKRKKAEKEAEKRRIKDERAEKKARRKGRIKERQNARKRIEPVFFETVEPRATVIYQAAPPKTSEATQTEQIVLAAGAPTNRNYSDASHLEKYRLSSEVKDQTLVVSGLLDEVQAKRENIFFLELSNATLCKQINFQRGIVEKLRNDLGVVEKDYTKADKQYQKGQMKSSAEKYYLRKNRELQVHILDDNIDLFVDMTVNDQVIPNVYRALRTERMQEQMRCVSQLRDRILRKRCDLLRIQEEVAQEEAKSDLLCKTSESLQQQVEDHGYSDHEAEAIAKLRTIAYSLGYTQFQADDLRREIDFIKEINTSRKNEFANELRMRALLFGDKVQALQDAVAKALAMNLKGKATAKVAKVSKCARPMSLPEEQRDWVVLQMGLCEVQKQVTLAEFENLSLEIKFSNSRLVTKLLKLKRRSHFTVERQTEFLNQSSCDAKNLDNDTIFHGGKICAPKVMI